MTVISSRAPLVFLDVETTGGHPAWHRVTEVGLLTVTGGRLEEKWSTLVNPGVSIPPSIQRLTGISDQMVREAPRFEDIAPELLRRVDGRIFVAHNARFDYGFIRGELRRVGINFQAPLACTVKISRRLFPGAGRHNLDALIERHGLVCDARHRALGDAGVLWQFWQLLCTQFPAQQLDELLADVARRPILPAQITADTVDDLPEAPGVYRLIGAGRALLYVGKANNLRERVLAHFAGTNRDGKSRRLAEQTLDIEWTETAGELGALLLEARLVRELKPVYNRRLRGGESLTWVVADDGRVELADLDATELRDQDAFGLFSSERAARNALAKLAREQKLCLKLLGLEASSGSCFGYQVGRCLGACTGAEPVARHTARLKLALVKSKLRPWPYEGAVALRERSGFGLEQLHVLDAWQYLGSFVEGEQFEPRFVREPRFDADAYRILTRFLRANPRELRPFRP